MTVFRLATAEEEVRNLRRRMGMVEDYERQILTLKEELAILTGRRNILTKASDYDVVTNG